MKIILDGMGGDNAPESIIDGAISAAAEIEDEIIIIGKEDILNETLRKKNYKGSQISVVNADEVITNDEAPVKAVRHKKESSLVKGITMVSEGQGDVFISAGSTGALLAGGLFILGRIGGIDRPTLATVYPVVGQEPSILTDTGANAECKAKNLLEFAIMGSIYMEKVLGRKDPTVGLVNNGSEAGKGTALTKEAYELLDQSDLNFIGNIEANDALMGATDIAVADGFSGNILLKGVEGAGKFMGRTLKELFLSNTRTKLAAAMIQREFGEFKKLLDPSEVGGTPFLGISRPVIKAHGSSDARAVKNAVRQAVEFAESGFIADVEEHIEYMKVSAPAGEA